MAFKITSLAYDSGQEKCTIGLHHEDGRSAYLNLIFAFKAASDETEGQVTSREKKEAADLLEEAVTWLRTN